MAFIKDFLELFSKLVSLGVRLDSVDKSLESVRSELSVYLDRLARIEAKYDMLKETLRGQVAGDVKYEVATALVEVQMIKRALTTGTNSVIEGEVYNVSAEDLQALDQDEGKKP